MPLPHRPGRGLSGTGCPKRDVSLSLLHTALAGSLLSVLLAFVEVSALTVTQEVWKKADEPCMASGPSGAWNYHKTDPSIVRSGSVLMMWYGTATARGTRTSIGHAVSQNGIDWTDHGSPVLVPGAAASSWDAGCDDIETPSVLIDEEAPSDQRFKMWYSALCSLSSTGDDRAYRIGYATSPDGIHWKRYEPKPTLDFTGDPFEWDGVSVSDPMVIKHNGIYKMWYSGVGVSRKDLSWGFSIGYATSSDGITWKKHPDNPVIRTGQPGSFESVAVGQPAVVFNGTFYEMWYSGWRDIETLWDSEIGYAYSPDGVNWTKFRRTPVIPKGSNLQWDSQQVVAASVILEGSTYRMWFTGMKVTATGPHIGIGHATHTHRPGMPVLTKVLPGAP